MIINDVKIVELNISTANVSQIYKLQRWVNRKKIVCVVTKIINASLTNVKGRIL